MNEKIPALSPPNARELNRMVGDMERRVMIIGRDQRTFSGVLNLRAGAYFVLGCVLALVLVLTGFMGMR